MAHLGTHSQRQIIQKKAENMKKKDIIMTLFVLAGVVFIIALPLILIPEGVWDIGASPTLSWTPLLLACGMVFLAVFFVAPAKKKRKRA
jgi:uncharacterized BrkB/YihY/UPF0761 family membrane protein